MRTILIILIVIIHDILVKYISEFLFNFYNYEQCLSSIGFFKEQSLNIFRRYAVSVIWDIVLLPFKLIQLSYLFVLLFILERYKQEKYIPLIGKIILSFMVFGIIALILNVLVSNNFGNPSEHYTIKSITKSSFLVGLYLSTAIICVLLLLKKYVSETLLMKT